MMTPASDSQRLQTGGRRFMALCGELADAVRDGSYTPDHFKRRYERNHAFIEELAASDDGCLRRLSEVMALILADVYDIENEEAVERLRTNGKEFQQIMQEVTGNGV